ncbi:MAG: AmmeMemoRadiSam system radical SAM enzyme, partial [Anaerolineae bacterium]|nr:AmmeMemoRadiSam system radical SAM enzyme [Anaerolineae bacterium]
RGIHLELTTLVIPGVNDDEETLRTIAERIYGDLGAETPWHLSAYAPAYRFSAPPTPVTALERGWRLAHEAGLEYVYLGNVPGHRLENTYCPGCGQLLIERQGFSVTQWRLRDHSCPECGKAVPIVT